MASSSVSSGRRSSVRQLDGEDENGAGRDYGARGGNGRASSKLGLDAHLVDDITRLPMRGYEALTCLPGRASPRDASLARCESGVINGADTCVRVAPCTQCQRARRDSVCPGPAAVGHARDGV